MGKAAVVVRFSVIVVEFNRFGEVGNGGVVVAVVELSHSSLVIALREILRINFDDLSEIGDSGGEVASGAIYHGALVISICVLRIKLDSLCIVLNGFVEASLPVK